ncbi:hypothetical protein BCR43DRAFT_488334 [Syncephalastrum racemosum]|uniref:Uncharacterized protein n=1 Tax=Syncephalastrum racemosum TaxID=13706 RepID=A0A1X2HJW4_SYNRA|nr:hypothetical protein BCR43DRAFT_488334 [Syncephalastrum racemosum]
MAPPPPSNVEVMMVHRRNSTTTATITKDSRREYRLPLTQYDRTHYFSKYDRRWRWWNIAFIFMFLFALFEAGALLFGGALLHRQPPPIRIALRQYPPMKYRHMPPSSTEVMKGTSVYHVTKEFGPAAMGGMGMVVTALAAAQQRSGIFQTHIVMPYYSFIKNKYKPERVVDLVVDIRDKEGGMVPVEFRVWKMMHVFDPPPPPENITSWEIIDGINTTVVTTPPPVHIPATEQVPVYLIGPGNRRPLNLAFRARSPLHVYSVPQALPMEWKDQFFSKAAAEFIAHQAASIDEISLFAPPSRPFPHVDIVHLHGATNAYVAKHLRDYEQRHQLGARPPAIMYTMHDYLDELQYTNTVSNVHKFLDAPDARLLKYQRGHRVFMSSLGIDFSDVTTFVSKTMAADIVEGRLDFYLKELVLDSVLRKAEEDRFFGITNGVDFGTLNPFNNKRMVSRKLAYPAQALDQVKAQPTSPGTVTWHLAASHKEYVVAAKDRAKKWLVRRGMLDVRDVDRPVVLFVGRFQYNKGLEIFDEACQYFVKNDMKLIIMGQPNNYPLSWVEALERRYPDHVKVMSTAREQRQWSVFYRAAADFAFVPSLTESFGLVAAEGLLFGAPVISTGAGGLREFLVDRPAKRSNVRVSRDKLTRAPTLTSHETYNAYLFEPSTLAEAISDAAQDYHENRQSKPRREEFLLRMIRSAVALGWDRDHHEGPVYEYMKAYHIALGRRQMPPLRHHEPADEQNLIARLQSSA